MSIAYRLEKDLNLEEAAELYRAAGWLRDGEGPALLGELFEHSFAVQAAFEAETGRLVGLMRALSDGVSDAYLLDLTVHPEYRRRGIGKELAERLSAHLKGLGIEWIVCIGAPGTEKFYGTTSATAMAGYNPWRFQS